MIVEPAWVIPTHDLSLLAVPVSLALPLGYRQGSRVELQNEQ